MLVNKIWDFKSLNMGRELEIAGEFIYDSAKKTMSISGLNNTYEINIILYTGAVGIERLQKIYLCLTSLGERPNSRNINGTEYEIIEHGNLSTAMLLRKFQTSFKYFTDEYGNNDELIIPYHTFFHDGFVPDAIVLDLCQALKGSEQEIVQQVADYFPDCDIPTCRLCLRRTVSDSS